AVAEDTLYVTIDEKPKRRDVPLKRVRNILENPRAAFVVDHYDEDWCRLGWIMLRGPTQILESGPEHDQAQELLRARYPQYRAMNLTGLPVIALRIARATGGGELPKPYYDAMDPFVSLSIAAGVTKKLKLATGVCLTIQRDTIQLAKTVASLDQVSGGRFLFGIGGGWNQDEMEDHGTVYATRFKKMREQVEAMQAIWTENKPEYHGEIVNFGPMMTWPKPVQKPHPPVIIGGMFPHAARRALRYGDGWIPHSRRPQYEDVTDFLPQF